MSKPFANVTDEMMNHLMPGQRPLQDAMRDLDGSTNSEVAGTLSVDGAVGVGIAPNEAVGLYVDGTDRTYAFATAAGNVAFNTVSGATLFSGNINVTGDAVLGGALDHNGTTVGFYGTAPVAKQTGVAVDAAAIHAALVALGLIGV